MDDFLQLVAGMPQRNGGILLGLVYRCGKCEDEEEFRRIMGDLRSVISFNFWKASIVELDENNQILRKKGVVDDSLTISAFPQRWDRTYKLKQLEKVDPIVERNFTRENFGLIQRWSDTFDQIINPKHEAFIEELTKFEVMNDGLTVGFKTENKPEGSMISLSGNVDFRSRSNRIMAILVPHLHHAMARVKSRMNRRLISSQQKMVLTLIQAGLNRSQVAKTMGISVGDVKYHLAQIYKKLGVNTQASAVSRALCLGILAYR